jgi:hypothetical protein
MIMVQSVTDFGDAAGDPPPRKGSGDVASNTSDTQPGASLADEAPTVDPSQAEIDEWAERERQRRQAWAAGPSADERAAYARRERERRLARIGQGHELEASDLAREMLRYPREMQLAAEGVFAIAWKWSRHQMAELIRAGREWEDEMMAATGRRRVPLDDDND